MTIVDFNSATWTDPWVRKLPLDAKTLFFYLWTNNHKNLIALYPLDIGTMAFEIGMTEGRVRKALDVLTKPQGRGGVKVKYDHDGQVVWVVNHVRHQYMRGEKVSPQIASGIKKCLLTARHPFARQFLEVYADLIDLSENLQQIKELIDKVSIPSIDPPIDPPGGGGGKGKGEGKEGGVGGENILPDWVPKDIWSDYLAMRKALKAPMTEKAQALAIGKLEKLKAEGHDPREVIEQSVMNSWKGFFPLKLESRMEKGSHSTGPTPCSDCGATDYAAIIGGRCKECYAKYSTR